MRPSLDSRGAPRRPAAGRRFMRLVLKFVALGSCWPLGHPDYRTGVSAKERLRKEVSGGRKPSDSSERVGHPGCLEIVEEPALSFSEGPIFKICACRAMSVMGI